jgi:hypothetical protein
MRERDYLDDINVDRRIAPTASYALIILSSKPYSLDTGSVIG